MATECFAQVRGRVVRVTRLDACGNPDPGASAVAVTDNITKITLEVVTDEGTNIRIRNFEDRVKVKDDAFTDVLGLTMSTTLCLTDPGFISVLTGQPVVMDDDGNVVGFDMNTGIEQTQSPRGRREPERSTRAPNAALAGWPNPQGSDRVDGSDRSFALRCLPVLATLDVRL